MTEHLARYTLAIGYKARFSVSPGLKSIKAAIKGVQDITHVAANVDRPPEASESYALKKRRMGPVNCSRVIAIMFRLDRE